MVFKKLISKLLTCKNLFIRKKAETKSGFSSSFNGAASSFAENIALATCLSASAFFSALDLRPKKSVCSACWLGTTAKSAKHRFSSSFQTAAGSWIAFNLKFGGANSGFFEYLSCQQYS